MNCTYFFDHTCYDNNINIGNLIIGGLLIISFISIPVCYIIKFCEIKKEKNIIPGYTHIDSNIDSESNVLPPVYNDSEKNV